MHPGDKTWMTPYIKTQIKARQRAFVKGDHDNYLQLRSKVASLIQNSKRKFYEDKARDLRHTNPSKWFKSIYSLCGAESSSVTPTAPNEVELERTADKLLEAFSAPWKDREPTALLVSNLANDLEDRPPSFPNIGQVKAIMKHLNPRKATGADGIPAWVLTRFHEELAPAVHDIICASIKQCKYPSSYKHALISPVPKVSNPVDINTDFRQISVLPHVAKILERIQLKLNHQYIKLKDSQHAFIEGRSTVTALTSITQDWFNATDRGCSNNGVHVVFVDFRKAFDLVDHGILLTKLAMMGVSKSFWLWCQSFLINRTQQVKLPGVTSKIGPVIAGVPQGGVISPTLFNVQVNDIDNCVNTDEINTCKYADDCSQYQVVASESNCHMQEAMDNLESWAARNKMELNAKKTKEMWISFKKTSQAPSPVNIGGTALDRVTEFKLLGVHIQNNLKWNTHVSTIVKKASKRIFHLRACRKANLPKDVGLTTYCTKIRPLLEYAAPIWGGLPQSLQKDLQRVQDRCLDVIGLPRDTVEPLVTRQENLTRKEYKRIVDAESHPCKRFLQNASEHNYSLRSRARTAYQRTYAVPKSYTERHKNSFIPRAARLEFQQ